jgi:hypothetical protein
MEVAGRGGRELELQLARGGRKPRRLPYAEVASLSSGRHADARWRA